MNDGDRIGPGGWASLALICASALFSSLLELLFLAQFYVGTVIVPVVIIAALAGNLVFPRWGFDAVPLVVGAVLPVVSWLLPVLGLTMYTRPEGDVFVLGAHGQQYAFYALLLIGAVAGFATIVVLSDPRRVSR